MTRALAPVIGLTLLAAATHAAAQPGPRRITPRDEAEVRALFAPHRLGGEVAGGWRLWSIRIEGREVRAGLRGSEDAEAELGLLPPDHPEARRGLPPSRSFAIVVRHEGGAGGRAALEQLAAAVRRNDRGGFWTRGSLGDPRVNAWIADGTLLSLLGVLLFFALLWRSVRAEPDRRRIAIALVAIFTVGLLLRVVLSPATILEAWSYSRMHPVAESVYGGPVLRWLSGALGARVGQVETIRTTTLVYASLTPLVVYLQARQLLRSTGVGLAAALIVAVLPHHLRFSHSDTAFVCSIAMSCLCDVLVHTACDDPRRAWRVTALLALGPLTFAMLLMRPLNVLFLPLFAAHAIWLVEQQTRRRWMVVATVGVAGALGIAVNLLVHYTRQIEEGLSPRVLLEGIGALVSFRYDTLIHPSITPPLVLLLAVIGGMILWRSGEKRRLGYLIAWLLAFFLAHAYVLPSELAMQARYHLHVILPFCFLAAVAFATFADQSPPLAMVLGVVLLLSPLLHRRFVTDVSFDDTREHAFVLGLRERIPEGCTVVEHHGTRYRREDARLPRIGAMLDRGRPGSLWRTRPVRDAAGAIGELERASRGGGCAVWYQSLLCFAGKPRDQPIAPACAEVRAHFRGRWRVLAARRFRHRLYDDNLGEGLRGTRDPTIEIIAMRLQSPKKHAGTIGSRPARAAMVGRQPADAQRAATASAGGRGASGRAAGS